jgi:hypothetical protein
MPRRNTLAYDRRRQKKVFGLSLGRWRSLTIWTGSDDFQRYWRSSVVQPSETTGLELVKHSVIWENVVEPDYLKNFWTTQILIDSFLIFIVLFVSVSKNAQVLILPTVISTHAVPSFHQCFFPLSPLICSHCFSLPPTCPIPQYVLPVLISHKYWADLMFDYHRSQ